MTVGMKVGDTRKLYSFLFISNDRWNGKGYKITVLFDREPFIKNAQSVFFQLETY
jgi:hypothetical protein